MQLLASILMSAVSAATSAPTAVEVGWKPFPGSSNWTIEVPLRLNNGAATFRIDRVYPSLKMFGPEYRCSLVCDGSTAAVRPGWTLAKPLAYSVITDKDEEHLLILADAGGSGATCKVLAVLNPRLCTFVSLTIYRDDSPIYPEWDLWFSDNARLPECSKEMEILGRVKHAAGYVAEEEMQARSDDPEYAWYFWRLDNYPLGDRALRFRTYEGPPDWGRASVVAQTEDASCVYYGYFKAGVIACDRKRNVHWVVYHPDDSYSWPTALLRQGDCLVIGTRYEGVAIVDLRTGWLTRHEVGRVNSLEAAGDEVLVNGIRPIPLQRGTTPATRKPAAK